MILSKMKIPLPTAIIMTVVGFSTNVFLSEEYFNIPLTAITSVGLFSIVNKIQLCDSPVYPLMRKMSTMIYFIHMYIWTAFYMLAYGEKTYGCTSFVVTTLISSAIAVSYIIFKRNVLVKRQDD